MSDDLCWSGRENSIPHFYCLKAELRAENERLRRDLEIWRRNGGDILLRAEIEQLLEANGRMARGCEEMAAENERLQAALRAARVVVEAEGARATLVIVDAALAGKEGE